MCGRFQPINGLKTECFKAVQLFRWDVKTNNIHSLTHVHSMKTHLDLICSSSRQINKSWFRMIVSIVESQSISICYALIFDDWYTMNCFKVKRNLSIPIGIEKNARRFFFWSPFQFHASPCVCERVSTLVEFVLKQIYLSTCRSTIKQINSSSKWMLRLIEDSQSVCVYLVRDITTTTQSAPIESIVTIIIIVSPLIHCN